VTQHQAMAHKVPQLQDTAASAVGVLYISQQEFILNLLCPINFNRHHSVVIYTCNIAYKKYIQEQYEPRTNSARPPTTYHSSSIDQALTLPVIGRM